MFTTKQTARVIGLASFKENADDYIISFVESELEWFPRVYPSTTLKEISISLLSVSTIPSKNLVMVYGWRNDNSNFHIHFTAGTNGVIRKLEVYIRTINGVNFLEKNIIYRLNDF